MKIIKWLLIVIVVLAVGLVGVGFLLPSKFRVERSAAINAPAEKVYGLIADPRAWTRWTVWNKRDPAMKIVYSGAPTGVGAKWSWESKSEGNGAMEFTRADSPRVVEFNLAFPDMGMNSKGSVTLETSGASTRVTWANYGDLGGNPLVRYFGLVMDAMVGPDFEAGLAGLKALAEKP